ncbi:MAG: nucleotidyltransferase family protein [Actinomycetia bacterium]|nr:nucleotidyltransferase family protein [Actinomycetes bacterium]
MSGFVAGLVLGAGASRRLGQPKQLLHYRGAPLLQSVVNTAVDGPFDQVIVAIGGAAPEVRTSIDFRGSDVVENVHFTTGCSSSIVAALDVLDERADGLVLLLGDQPGVTTDTIEGLIAGASAPLAVCRYDDGRGHPFWFSREVLPHLRQLQGDKAVWKLLESGQVPVAEVPCEGPVPLDVDTWDDYERLLAQETPA